MKNERNAMERRKIDNQGRVVIPKGLRRKYEISEGDDLEISDDGKYITICKRSPKCVFCSSRVELYVYKKKYICEQCLEGLQKKQDS